MRDRDAAVIVNHTVAVCRTLLNELLDTPLSDEKEVALKCDGIVAELSALRAHSRRIREDELDRRGGHPRETCPPVEIGSWR
jgi:hypothetical protein